MAPAEPPSRFTVTLDASVPLERLILTRLQALNTRARQSWLRSLLMQGFMLECRLLQMTREPLPTLDRARTDARLRVPPSAPYTLSAASRFTGNTLPAIPVREPTAEVTATTRTDGKPFAHLRRVIG